MAFGVLALRWMVLRKLEAQAPWAGGAELAAARATRVLP